ncbi:MAG: nickel pincer cofactor biosynthesis protein LarB [Acidimicrobiia bacterium]|nr:nickel pincer cofactor biosynthesis protein LarB [Acidimicrobiia bacterium]
MPEAVLCQFKTVDQTTAAITGLLDAGDTVIATRITDEQRPELEALGPQLTGMGTMAWQIRQESGKTVALISAGTSDVPVADEAAVTLAALGHTTRRITDVGVAGVHRLQAAVPEFEKADVLIAFAGMEGALPTVLAGLVSRPIIAVPTSVGYGSAFEGVTALLTMLSSCAPGISVVGIDNGYGAACAAHRILQP